MKCPFCGCDDTQVKDSRNADDNTAIRRRRECPECGSRFTTFERIQLRELIVVKKNGERVMMKLDDYLGNEQQNRRILIVSDTNRAQTLIRKYEDKNGVKRTIPHIVFVKNK